jgi:dienelactone hydrolase
VREPESGSAPPYPTLIALHGNNNSSQATIGFWEPAVRSGLLVSVPQSTQLGIRPQVFIWDDYDLAKRDVLKAFDALSAQGKVDAKRVILGGFSMGGQTAIRMALDGSLPAAGFIAVGPWMGLDPNLKYLQSGLAGAKARGVRGVILIGEKDEGSIAGVRRLAELLTEHGIEHRLKIYPEMAHAYPPDFAAQIEEAVKFILP